MPKLPRDVSYERLRRFLLRHGWTLAREGARHAVFAREGEHVSVPRHGSLKTGTLAAILRQAGLMDRADDL
jgi:predicted RNA binding protein YcfA (HicA-like mRNA interferase family)